MISKSFTVGESLIHFDYVMEQNLAFSVHPLSIADVDRNFMNQKTCGVRK